MLGAAVEQQGDMGAHVHRCLQDQLPDRCAGLTHTRPTCACSDHLMSSSRKDWEASQPQLLSKAPASTPLPAAAAAAVAVGESSTR